MTLFVIEHELQINFFKAAKAIQISDVERLSVVIDRNLGLAVATRNINSMGQA